MALDTLALRSALAHPLERTDLDELGRRYEGKVRDNYTTADGRRFIVTTDRISAFDRILGCLPFKGQLLNRVAAWWFEATRDIVKSHLIDVPDPNVLVARECTPLPVEMVVRAYLTGTTSTSIWVHYEKGAREFCGHRLPDGLKKHARLPEPILTPSTKAEKGAHDELLHLPHVMQISTDHEHVTVRQSVRQEPTGRWLTITDNHLIGQPVEWRSRAQGREVAHDVSSVSIKK